jgi:hypothetical protein
MLDWAGARADGVGLAGSPDTQNVACSNPKSI